MAEQRNTERKQRKKFVPYSHKEHEQHQGKRDRLSLEINGLKPGPNFVPKARNISFEVFEKSKEERKTLKIIKANHKEKLRRAGLDPKKHMNVIIT